MKYLCICIGLLFIFGCKTYSEEDLATFDTKIKNYLREKNVDCKRSESGLYYNITDPGEGRKIQYTDIVSFTYSGSLLSGEIFDTQKDPVEFEVKELIGAWKEIMLELKKGGKAYLVAPPNLGYGTHDLDDIPSNSILVFELEVIDVK
jgi:FKBP-type peptidyl-prolyl cis-trans isomerase FkpA